MNYASLLRQILRAAATCERTAPGRLIVPDWPLFVSGRGSGLAGSIDRLFAQGWAA